jgi:hypothetical protein
VWCDGDRCEFDLESFDGGGHLGPPSQTHVGMPLSVSTLTD